METQFHPEILEISESLVKLIDDEEKNRAQGDEQPQISYSCGRCPPGSEM